MIWGAGVEELDDIAVSQTVMDVEEVLAPKTPESTDEEQKVEDTVRAPDIELSYENMYLDDLGPLEDMIEQIDPTKLPTKDRRNYTKMVRGLVQNSFYSYLKASFDETNPLITGRHIRLLCNALTRLERGELAGTDGVSRLIITMPPRHLKSRTISESFPSWAMAKNQTRNTIAVSYSATLGEKFGQKNKEKFTSLGKEYFSAGINQEVRSKGNWETEKGAKFLGTGMGGSVTGSGADILIIDDPYKNRKDADSEVYRKFVWEEWEDTLQSRLHDKAIVIIIHTRWHDNDLIGELINKEGHRWLQINLPAECEDEAEDLIGRKLGEPLWPENGFDNTYFLTHKRSRRTWNALYQQRPVALGGNLFKSMYFKYFNQEGNMYVLYDGSKEKRFRKSECWKFQTIDTALKDEEQHDPTAIQTIIVTPDWDVLIFDMFNERLEVPKLPEAITNQRVKHQPSFQVIEDRASGTGLAQEFSKTAYPLRTIKANGSKVVRCYEILTMYERGKVYHYIGMQHLDAFEAQLSKFPTAKNDDMVDVTAYAGKVIAEMDGNASIWELAKGG